VVAFTQTPVKEAVNLVKPDSGRTAEQENQIQPFVVDRSKVDVIGGAAGRRAGMTFSKRPGCRHRLSGEPRAAVTLWPLLVQTFSKAATARIMAIANGGPPSSVQGTRFRATANDRYQAFGGLCRVIRTKSLPRMEILRFAKGKK
jgi:hypothetical protein